MLARSILAGLVLSGLTASPAEDAYPSYGVSPGTDLVRVWTSSTRLESKAAQIFVDGEEIPSDARGELRLRVTDDKKFEADDAIGAVEGGRPTRFERTYREFSNRSTETLIAVPKEGDEVERTTERERTTPLEGRVVRFTFDPKKDEHARAFVLAEDAAAPDADLLAGLTADADWLVILEDGPREKGATFEIDAQVFERVQYPLGDLHWHVEGKPADALAREINSELSENLSGQAKATWQGVREEGGRQVGVFDIEADLKSRADADTADGRETRTVELELEYEGRILWDMAAGRPAGYSFEAAVRSVLSTTREVDGPQGKVAVRQVFDLEGTAKHALAVRAD